MSNTPACGGRPVGNVLHGLNLLWNRERLEVEDGYGEKVNDEKNKLVETHNTYLGPATSNQKLQPGKRLRAPEEPKMSYTWGLGG